MVLTGNRLKASLHVQVPLQRVLCGSGTVPIVLLDRSGWSPGTALAWTLGPGS